MEKLIIISILQFCFFYQEADEKLIGLCKIADNVLTTNNVLRIDYVDSTHGISKIKQSSANDTLIIKICVSFGKVRKTHDINIDSNIQYIKIGNRVFEMDKLSNCVKSTSGKEALEELKKMK